MHEDEPKGEQEVVDVSRLLRRGGQTYGLAALAHARGQSAGEGPWFVLPPEVTGPVEEILIALEQRPSAQILKTVTKAVMSARPATAPPSWAIPLSDDLDLLARLGSSIDIERLIPALGLRKGDIPARQKGLAALAIALCRSLDSLCALAELLPEGFREELVRMGYLAHVLVEPGDPARMRAYLKQRLKEILNGGTNRQGE